MFTLNKFSLIILTRCNLRCRLCCEYVPQNKPFPDMTADEEKRILEAVFDVADHITTLHLTGGGEPFLHRHLAELTEAAMVYADKFDTLMLFTNCTVPVSPQLMEVLVRYRGKILVQVSQYGNQPEKEAEILQSLLDHDIRCKVVNYSGKKQDFGGWVDFGPWEAQGQEADMLKKALYILCGNKRYARQLAYPGRQSSLVFPLPAGMDLGLIPDCPEDYVDLFDSSTREEKQEKFRRIASSACLSACDRCSGDAGTENMQKRYPAAEQL